MTTTGEKPTGLTSLGEISIVINKRPSLKTDDYFSSIDEQEKIPVEGMDVNTIMGKHVYIIGISKEKGPFGEKTFIEAAGKDEEGEYIVINNFVEGATLTFSEIKAREVFEEKKSEYIEAIKGEYATKIEEIQKSSLTFETPVIKVSSLYSALRLNLGLGDGIEGGYTSELSPELPIGTPVYSVKFPGDRGSKKDIRKHSSGTIDETNEFDVIEDHEGDEFEIVKDYMVIGTEVFGFSITNGKITYDLKNGEELEGDIDNNETYFLNKEKAEEYVTGKKQERINELELELKSLKK